MVVSPVRHTQDHKLSVRGQLLVPVVLHLPFCLSRETCVTLLGQDLREIAGQGVADHVANVFHVGNIETIISGNV